MSFRGLTVFLGIASGVAVMQPPETFSANVLPANQQAERNGASTMPANDNRYQGKPLLRLLELYVIWSIGELSEADASRLEGMAPKLQATLGGDGTWQSAIDASMHLTADTPARIEGIWEKNQAIASQNGLVLTPQQFAEMFVDSNWVP